jgi:arylsulfatase A-like enzyme
MGHDVKGEFDRRADETTRSALKWLTKGRATDQPFFLWVHYFDPHGPYDPPEPYRSKYRVTGNWLDQALALYDGEIEFTDSQVGLLVDDLDALGLRSTTLLVVVGDHGEGLMQHRHLEHGLLIYEEAVRVPLIFRWPSVLPAGSAIPGPVELVDLMPTILGMLKVPMTDPVPQGRNLESVIKGDAAGDDDRIVYLQRRLYDPGVWEGHEVKGLKLGVRSGKWKYIEAPDEGTKELYDLQSDSGELHNLYSENQAIAEGLAAALKSWEHRFGTGPVNEKVSDEDRERLKALGYVQ